MTSRPLTRETGRRLASTCLIALTFGQSMPAQAEDNEAAASHATSNEQSAQPGLQLLEPRLNAAPAGDPIFVATWRGDIWLPSAFLKLNHIAAASGEETILGVSFVPLKSLPGMTATADVAQGRIDITCQSSCFTSDGIFASRTAEIKLSPVEPGGFFNYDVFAQAGDIPLSAGGYAELGFFTDAGTGLSSFYCSQTRDDGHCGRLETNWTIDDPARAQRLVIGDTITQAASWGAPARYGGVRWGTDFSLRPDFVTFPTPVLKGQSALASSIDVYINDALRFQTNAQAGPFRISDIPIVTGEGTIRTVVTDVLGREQTIETGFYAAPQLLKPRLQQYSVEAGLLRRNFDTDSGDYRDAFVAGSYSRGLSDALTVGARSEISAEQSILGVSVATANTSTGISEISFAASNSKGRSGALARFAQEYRSAFLSAGGSVNLASPEFQPFGADQTAPRVVASVFVSIEGGSYGSASLNWTYRDEREAPNFSAVGLRYSSRIFGASLLLSALKTIEPQPGYRAFATLAIPLGGGSVSSGADYDGHKFGGEFRLQDEPPLSGGTGYHLHISKDGVERYDAGVIGRSQFGDLAADFSSVDRASALRLSARGGAAIVDGEWVAARSIGGGIAVVFVGGEPNVRVYHDRQLVGVSDADGRIVVPGLRSFEDNELSFEADDLDLQATFNVAHTTIVPGYRTGHKAVFAIKRPTSFTAQIVAATGEPLPVGASVANATTGEIYSVGSNGRIYIENASPVVRLTYGDGKLICSLVIETPKPAPDASIPDAGRTTCSAPLPMVRQ